MPIFDYSFTVNAPRAAVTAFHSDTKVLKTLTPPPIFIQIHYYEPLAENSVARFTLWFGPFPIHWEAIHSQVDENGFTDTQAQGPLKRWQHSHRFNVLSATQTQIHEHIDYEYAPGLRGIPGRILFSKPALTLLFTARKLITRRKLMKKRTYNKGKS